MFTMNDAQPFGCVCAPPPLSLWLSFPESHVSCRIERPSISGDGS